MLLQTPYKELFNYEVNSILSELDSIQEDTWLVWNYRQKMFRNVHGHTQSIPFLWSMHWTKGSKVNPSKFNHNTALWDSIVPLITKLENYYSGTCISALFAKLIPGGTIPEHIDYTDRLELVHRCHIPIKLPSNVDFIVRGEKIPFKVGTVYEISNQDVHSVTNNSNEDRIHLILDILPNIYSKGVS